MNATEKKPLNIEDVAAAIGVPKKEVEMMGRKMNMTQWSPEFLVPMLDYIKPIAEKGDPVSLGGPGDHWVLAGAGVALGDTFAEYVAGNGTMEMIDLPMGEENPEGGVHFLTYEDGDKLYIAFDPDDHTKPMTAGPHNYDVSKLPHVVVPPCRPDQDVFITGGGGYGILLTILKPYFGDKCRSLSVSPGHGNDSGYICVKAGGSLKAGDISPFHHFE